MSIEQLIKENTEALVALTNALKAFSILAATEAKPEKVKAKKVEAEKPKEEFNEKQEQPSVAKTPTAEVEEIEEEVEEPTTISEDEFKKRVLEVVRRDKAKVSALLESWGVARATELTPDQYEGFLSAIGG